MEEVKVREWLRVDERSGSGEGWGWGSGSGEGWGEGSGSGWGWGSGSGSGEGWGWGSGWGSGEGWGIKSFNGQTVYMIDNVPTIITSIHFNMAKGFILNDDLTLTPCHVVKYNGMFAHGETPQKAAQALRAKIFESMDTDEAIEKFCETFKPGEQYSGHEFFEWHHYLTGSCEMGRKAFVSRHDLDLDKTYTVYEFIELTENDYGSEIIKNLKERYR